MDGTSTGVISSEQMKAENRKKRYQEKERSSSRRLCTSGRCGNDVTCLRLYGLDDQATGKGAETVYRNRDGRRVTREELEKEHAKVNHTIKSSLHVCTCRLFRRRRK